MNEFKKLDDKVYELLKDALNGFAVEGEPEDAFGEKKEAPSFE